MMSILFQGLLRDHVQARADKSFRQLLYDLACQDKDMGEEALPILRQMCQVGVFSFSTRCLWLIACSE